MFIILIIQIQNIYRAINIAMDSAILDQFNKLQLVEKDVDSEVKVIKTKRGHKKKTDTKTLLTINKEDTNSPGSRRVKCHRKSELTPYGFSDSFWCGE